MFAYGSRNVSIGAEIYSKCVYDITYQVNILTKVFVGRNTSIQAETKVCADIVLFMSASGSRNKSMRAEMQVW